ncbi:MAG: hypothetical protein M1831_001078 [Alyxoria varia]|nr:MAG: hypothetical protein M1831_001078 [Alyxoria varia]
MATTSNDGPPAASTPNVPTLDIKVFSQLPHPNNEMLFPALPVTTSLMELKTKIAARAPGDAPIARQRLIHKGHVQNVEASSLGQICGSEAVAGGGTQSLHLVLRGSQRGNDSERALPTLQASRLPVRSGSTTPSPSGQPRQNSIGTNGSLNAPTAATTQDPAATIRASIPLATAPSGTATRSSTPGAMSHTQHTVRGPPIAAPNPHHPNQPSQSSQNITMDQNMWQQMMNMQQASARQAQTESASSRQSPHDSDSNTAQPGSRSQHRRPGDSEVEAMNRALGNIALNMAMDPHRPPDWLSNNTHQEGQPEGTSRSQSVPPANPTAARLNQTSGHLRPSGSESVINQGQPNGFAQQGVGPHGEHWRVTVNSTTGPMPPNIVPPQFGVPTHPPYYASNQQQTFNQRSVPPPPPPFPWQNPATNFSNTAAPSRSPNSLPGWGGLPPLGLNSEFYGARHAIDSMRQYERDLQNLQRRLSDHAPSANAAQGQLAQSFDQQAQHITRVRNRAQRMVNDLLMPGRIPYHDGLNSEDVATLHNLNVNFTSIHAQVQQATRGLRRGSESNTNSSNAGHPGSGSRTREGHWEQNADATPNSSNQTGPTTTYVLYGPDGPRAVVFSPQGTFTDPATAGNRPSNVAAQSQPPPGAITQTANRTQPQADRSNNGRMTDEEIDRLINQANTSMETINREIATANENINRVHNQMMQQNPSGESSSLSNTQGREIQPQQQQALAQQPNGPEREQAAEAQAEQDAQAMMRVVGPFFRHVWLLIRIGAFIWFLTRGGAASRRTLFLCVASLFYFAIQAGFMRDQIAYVRRHFENLMGVHGDDEGERGHQAQQGQQQQNRAAEVPALNGARPEQQRQGQAANPNPDLGAARASGTNAAATDNSDNAQQDRGALRNRLTSLERAVALFFASLYPGVGERQVAARERRAREAAEQEVRRNRERGQQEVQQRSQQQTTDRPHEHQD